MTALTISRDAVTAMQVAQFIRNGKAPTADIQNQLSTMVGYAAKWKSKCIWRSPGELSGTAGASLVLDSLATRPRWRFPLHTSPYHWYLMARFEIAPENTGTPSSPSCRIDIAGTDTVVVGSSTVYGGSSNGTYADVPINMTGGVTIVLDAADPNSIAPLTTDTEYTGVFYDVGLARLQSASIWEVTLDPDTDSGYAENNHASGSPIYSSHRNDVAAMARLLHKRSGTPVFHWCSNVDSSAPVSAGAGGEGNAAMTLGALTLTGEGTTSTGTGSAEMTLGALTMSATGTIAEFDAVVSGTSPWTYTVAQTFTVTATATGAAQTNGSITVLVYDSYSPSSIVSSATTTNADGWSETGWSSSLGIWSNTYTKASVSVGSTAPTFQLAYSNTGHVYVTTFLGGTPHTDQSTGDGNYIDIDLNDP